MRVWGPILVALIGAAVLLPGCATSRINPKEAAKAPALSCSFGERGGYCQGATVDSATRTSTFSFSHALIQTDRHGWSIAPEELLDPAYRARLIPVRVAVEPVTGCARKTERLLSRLRNKPAYTLLRVSGSGRWHESKLMLIVDCITEAQPYTVSEPTWWSLWAPSE